MKMTLLNVFLVICVFNAAKGRFLREHNQTTPWNINELVRQYMLGIMGSSKEAGPLDHYDNCTPRLKNRLVMFEYLYYGSGSWLYPYQGDLAIGYNTRTMDSKTSTDYHFVLRKHNYPKSTTIESRRKGWEEYFVTEYPTYDAMYIVYALGMRMRSSPQSAIADIFNAFQIHCTSCEPSGPNNDTFDDCRISIPSFEARARKLWYVSNGGYAKLYYWKTITPSWVNWRIISPTTKSYWKRMVTVENCDDDPDAKPVHAGPYILKTTITHTTSITVSWTVKEKLDAGNFALKLLCLDPNPEISMEWSRTDIDTIASEKSVSFGPELVEPGWKWTIDQYYGEAAFTLIGSETYRSPLKHCNAV